MDLIKRRNAVEALNSLEIIETNGGEEAYALFENNEGNHAILNEAGISSDVINRYGDGETSCLLSIGMGEGYADLWDGNKLIVFDSKMEIQMKDGLDVVLFKHEGVPQIALSYVGGEVLIKNLSDEQVDQIKKVIA